MLTARSGQQKISMAFLLEIGWVQRKGTSRRPFPRPQEVELVPVNTLIERYTVYLDLMRVNPHALADRIFCGEAKWVDRVIATFD